MQWEWCVAAPFIPFTLYLRVLFSCSWLVDEILTVVLILS